MSKEAIPFVAEDISAFSKALGKQLKAAETPPGHLALMNMVARAGGYRNFQHLRASEAAKRRLDDPPVVEAVDHKRIEAALRIFDEAGRMTRWPTKRSIQDLCLWVFWAALPRAESMTEKEVNAVLNDAHLFGDPAILRRMLVTQGFATRNLDGSDYRRATLRPSGDGKALISAVSKRRNSGI